RKLNVLPVGRYVDYVRIIGQLGKHAGRHVKHAAVDDIQAALMRSPGPLHFVDAIAKFGPWPELDDDINLLRAWSSGRRVGVLGPEFVVQLRRKPAVPRPSSGRGQQHKRKKNSQQSL